MAASPPSGAGDRRMMPAPRPSAVASSKIASTLLMPRRVTRRGGFRPRGRWKPRLSDFEARAARTDPPMSVGLGSPTGQVIFGLFAAASGTRPVAASYWSTQQAMIDLAGGHIDAAVVGLFTGLGQMRSDAVRALAVSAARSSLALEVPTLQEAFPAA